MILLGLGLFIETSVGFQIFKDMEYLTETCKKIEIYDNYDNKENDGSSIYYCINNCLYFHKNSKKYILKYDDIVELLLIIGINIIKIYDYGLVMNKIGQDNSYVLLKYFGIIQLINYILLFDLTHLVLTSEYIKLAIIEKNLYFTSNKFIETDCLCRNFLAYFKEKTSVITGYFKKDLRPYFIEVVYENESLN
jgi:hypothetical protein